MESFVHLALALLVALGVLWACYGFEVRPASGPDRVPTDVLVTMTHPFGSAGLALQKLSRHAWLPLRSHLSGFVMMRDQQAGTRECYLLGVTARHGWWYYFPVAIAVKTPVPMLILLLLSLALFRRLRREDGFSEVTLLLPVAVMLYFAMRSPINIGLRHVLPIYPLLFVFVSKTARLPSRGCLAWTLFMAVLMLWYLQSAFSIYPHYLAYFNELAGGPSQGHKFLVDSNLDWGQDLKRLAEFQRRHPEARPLRLAYFGSAPPSAYGVEREPLATGTPVTGWVAASVTLLRLQPDGYDWLKAHRPVATLGYSINVYEIGGRRALE